MAESTVQHTSTPPSAKRKRTERDDQGGTQEPAKSSTYWFEDGNFILQAQNIQFRVHRSVIARHSQVFRDMFSLPQPATEILFDGCPLVRVSDAPHDWENLFSILYDHDPSYSSTDEFAFPLLATMLRLGKKYQFDSLQATALKRIRVELPDTLDRWVEKFSDDESGLVSESDREVDLVNLLLEMGILSLLPMAYFLCLKYLNPVGIFRGVTRDDGIVSHLSAATIEKLILARDEISEAILAHEFKWATTATHIPTPKCFTRALCESQRSQVFEMLCPGPQPGQALVGPDEYIGTRYCSSCASEIRRVYFAGRKHIWENLPSYFELPDWKDLKDV